MVRKYWFILLVFISLEGLAQRVDFVSPVDIPIQLTGNFGEIRGGHFHAGIDIKTNGKIGLPIYAAEAGFVSRIAISPYGYGNAIYVQHKNGYTTVYGHLNKFKPEIERWIRSKQYEVESFKINRLPDSTLFRVEKGELIAYSGNSGGSGGPHLHFEIRETFSEHPINPLTFNFTIADKIKPKIESLYVYPLSDSSHVGGNFDVVEYRTVFYDGAYHLHGRSGIKAYGPIGFGLDALDYLDGSWSKCGVYRIELKVDDTTIYEMKLDELDYHVSRHLNSHIDYAAYKRSNKKIHKTFIEPGNKLAIYKNTINQGIFSFNDNQKHTVEFVLYDVHGNKTRLFFNVEAATKTKFIEQRCDAYFKFDQQNSFKNEQIEVELPEYSLYSDLRFQFGMDLIPVGAFSPIYHVHNIYSPLDKNMSIKIKADSLPHVLAEKALIVRIHPRSFKRISVGGSYESGWVHTSTRSFGDYCIMVDTLAPEIKPLSINGGKILREKSQIRFRIKDDLSGIKRYRGEIDGNWVLFEYDAKNNMLRYAFDEYIQKGKKHKLVLTVEDRKENIASYEAIFYY